jgi:hypothetical protein
MKDLETIYNKISKMSNQQLLKTISILEALEITGNENNKRIRKILEATFMKRIKQ